MQVRILLQVLICGLGITPLATNAQSPKPSPDLEEKDSKKAIVASLQAERLIDFEKNSPEVQALITKALALTEQNLTYTYGSADPAKGGMDCSGTIYYLLREAGVRNVPRTASAQYLWTRKAGTFETVVSRSMNSYELKGLRPGDLLFWTGTYATKVDPPVTHSMIYLGKRKKDKKPVMFGASDGRTYDGKAMWGVSVFDFRLPKPPKKPREGEPVAASSSFIGYARIPGLTSVED